MTATAEHSGDQASGRVRVLVFPCGSEPGSEIYQALRYSINVTLAGASSVDDHGRFRYPDYHVVPRIDDAGFDEAFAGLLDRLGIELLFSTHDTVSAYLATRAEGWGVQLVNGDPRATALARRKSATYELFEDCSWCPAIYPDLAAAQWPAVVKPDQGQGGQGVAIVRSREAAEAALAGSPESVLVEYLPGEELTVDCFTDRKRRLLWVGPRTRERVRSGISMRSSLLDLEPKVAAIADDINSRLTLRGPWFFQIKRDRHGRWKLLEISCRIAGNMAAQRARGVNLPLMAVHDFLGRDLMVLAEPRVRTVDRNIATRAELEFEFDTVFVDLDDTLIIDGQVTPVVVQFLYQCRSEGKRIVLITRHAHDCAATLDQACLAPHLFDEVVHITDGTSKSRHMTPKSIFIDNHFPERSAVSRALGIPVLDVDMLEFLVR